MNVMFITTIIAFALLNLQSALTTQTTSGHTKYVTSSVVSTFKRRHEVDKHSTVIVIEQHSPDMCTARVDFLTFNLGIVYPNGYCSQEQMWEVDQHDFRNVPVLCGENTGQHVYVEFKFNESIYMIIHTNHSKDDDWKFKITQIACDDYHNKGDRTCLQYFKERSGTFKSFNFKKIDSVANGAPDTCQLSNLYYHICFGPPYSTFTSITFTRPDDATNYYFPMSGNVQSIPPSVAGSQAAAEVDVQCYANDPFSDYAYLDIQGGQFVSYKNGSHTQNAFRYCGLGFPHQVRSFTRPFVVTVVTDSSQSLTFGSFGFYLKYHLN